MHRVFSEIRRDIYRNRHFLPMISLSQGSGHTLADPERCTLADLSDLHHVRRSIEEPRKISVEGFQGQTTRSAQQQL